MDGKVWTSAERVFRGWMLISAMMYALGCIGFLVIGKYIPAIINRISRITTSLPLYPLPADGAEGAFWTVLASSMMAMITWIAVQAYRDPRRNANLVPILLLSKACSTGFYTVLFVFNGHLAYIVGFLTDGPIFLLTAGLWYAAAGGDRYLTPGEERILMALGDAFMPRGGRFALGYADTCDACLSEARRMLAQLNVASLTAIRLGLHMVNWAPLTSFRRRLIALTTDERAQAIARLEARRSVLLRMFVVMAKTMTLVPFFDQPEAAQAVGYDPDARVRS